MLCRTLTCAAALAVAFAAAAGPAEPKDTPRVKLHVAMGTSSMLADQKHTGYLRVAMTGFEQKDPAERPPVNVAFVLDKSGSMQGAKLQHAKDAAILAIDRLRGDDIVSVVAYDTTVHVLVPATKVADRHSIYSAIRGLTANRSTALFAGVSKGAQELRKFLDKKRVNRVVLLSDGLANEGPSSPGDLAELGTSLGSEGITVTTIGLGASYNEDLMYKLAQASDGNHVFAEQPSDLETAFNDEFGDVLSVVAQDVDVEITCFEGIRPVRVLGREADIEGQTIHLGMNQLYSEQTKYIVIEVEVPARPEGTVVPVATAKVSYLNMASNAADVLSESAQVRLTASPNIVAGSTNKEVMEAAIRQIGVERYAVGLALRDQGRIDEAIPWFISNAGFLAENAEKLGSDALREDSMSNTIAGENLDENNWSTQRKVIREKQFEIIQQKKGK